MVNAHVHVVLGMYILLGALGGAIFAYPSRARNPLGSGRKEGSKEPPPKKEARDPTEGILLKWCPEAELGSAEFLGKDTLAVLPTWRWCCLFIGSERESGVGGVAGLVP